MENNCQMFGLNKMFKFKFVLKKHPFQMLAGEKTPLLQ